MTDEDVTPAEPSDDPYDVDLPADWTAATATAAAGTTRYERSDGTLRVEITEFSRGLSLYWWVDAYERVDGDWSRVEAGLGDSFTRAVDAAAAAQSFLDEVRAGDADRRGDGATRPEPAGIEQF